MLGQTGFHKITVRSRDDYYVTPAVAAKALLRRERFKGQGWEPASGSEAIAKFFPDIMASDIRTDGDVYGQKGVDLLKTYRKVDFIVTNPPLSLLLPFMAHSLECVFLIFFLGAKGGRTLLL